MKKILLYIIGLLTGGIVWSSCTSDDNWTDDLEQGNGTNFTLQIKSGELQSRSATIAESESSIQTLDIYLYPNGAEDEDALFHYLHELQTVDTDGSETVTVNIPGTTINNLFPNGATTCTAYVIANKGELVLPTDDTSIASLKGIKLNDADFTKQQDLFVMDGSNTVNYSADDKTISGYVDLYRAASKISLTVTGVKSVVEDDFGNKWQCDPANQIMRVGFYNGIKRTNVDVKVKPYTISDGDYFNIPNNPGRNLIAFSVTNNDETTTTHYRHELPFYSYSSAWNSGDPTAPYLIVVVPWQKLDEEDKPVGSFIPCYYQIPINEKNKKLERNHYYEVKLNIGILGSFTPDEPLTLNDATYVVLDWSKALTTAKLKEYRYLVVDKNYVEMDNVNSIDVGMATSHDISYEIISITRPNYSSVTESTDVIYDKEKSVGTTNGFTFQPNTTVASSCNKVTFSHMLDNERSDRNYDYVPYTIKVKVWHTDDSNYFEIIEYKQYPAIYIVVQPNSGYPNNNKGYVFVNKNNATVDDWTVVNTLGGTTSVNPNMYVINVSAFSDGDYIIGDPRTNVPLSPLGFTPSTDNNSKTLQYYYPTSSSEAYENYISPKFRICSAYGRLGSVKLTKQTVVNRCASYQEDGYPAGRWRVPTSAELEFMGKLCAEKKIPALYTNGNSYWSASSCYTYSTNNGGSITEINSSTAYVRCVYDEWYWTDKCDETTFTWGDKQITW